MNNEIKRARKRRNNPQTTLKRRQARLYRKATERKTDPRDGLVFFAELLDALNALDRSTREAGANDPTLNAGEDVGNAAAFYAYLLRDPRIKQFFYNERSSKEERTANRLNGSFYYQDNKRICLGFSDPADPAIIRYFRVDFSYIEELKGGAK